MSKKIILVLVMVFFFSRFSSAFAGLTINEIMYDLSGSDSANSKSREWIEIYNSGSADVSVDASKWRLYDGGANRTINGEVNFIIPASNYVIFAGDKDTFLLDHPGFGGVIYDTGFTSLNNTTATLKILDQDGNAVDEATYTSSQGGSGDGNSLQKISGSWKGAAPTPGVSNETTISTPPPADNSSNSESSNNNSSGSSGSVSISEAGVKTAEIQKIKTKIMAKTLGFVGLPISLDAIVSGISGEQLHYGRYFWNFGDGDSKEAQVRSDEKLAHTYFYPGDYAVSLDYFSNSYIYSNIPDASDRIIIKIVGTDISISRVGEEKDFFVELSNNTGYDADLSGWILASDAKSFTIPRNTILQPKKTMIISPRITDFSITDKNSLKLMNPQQETVFDYSASIAPTIPAKIVAGNIAPVKLSVSKVKNINKNVTDLVITENAAKNLPALALNSGPAEQDEKNPYSFPIIPLASFIFIGASAGAVYFIRRKKVIAKTGDDFEILDE